LWLPKKTLAMYDLGMTQLLEKAFNEVQRLSEKEQNTIAERILLELDEQRWTELFATPESQAWLEEMGAQALAAHETGKTIALNVEDL
jgi:hypothetical protein